MKHPLIPADRAFEAWKKDPKYVAAYDALNEEFAWILASIKADGDANKAQEKLATEADTPANVPE